MTIIKCKSKETKYGFGKHTLKTHDYFMKKRQNSCIQLLNKVTLVWYSGQLSSRLNQGWVQVEQRRFEHNSRSAFRFIVINLDRKERNAIRFVLLLYCKWSWHYYNAANWSPTLALLTSEDGRLCCLSLRLALNDSNEVVWTCDALKQVAPFFAQTLCLETAELK